MAKTKITVETTVGAPIGKVWKYFTEPKHIMKWNTASEDWHSPRAENDVRIGGVFSIRMEAKDGSEGFDFGGTYDEVIPEERLAYTMGDGREVVVIFTEEGGETHIIETFEAETQNSIEMQQGGWQSILTHFKQYVESL